MISKSHLQPGDGMGFAKTEKEWAERAARHLKAELKRADLTYEELAERLREHGFEETKASIANKLARATLSAHLFLASLAAMGAATVALEDI
jgi:DNA-binding transcriptional ArsR family regulator